MTNNKSEGRWDELHASTDVRVIVRYQKADRLLVFNLREQSEGGAEVWINEETDGTVRTIERRDFTTPDDVITWLAEEEKTLKADGWRELDARSRNRHS